MRSTIQHAAVWVLVGLCFLIGLLIVFARPVKADRSDCKAKVERSYRVHYAKVKQAHGTRAPGRNIRKNGVLFRKVVFNSTCGELRRSTKQLKRLLRPPSSSWLVRSAVPPPQPPAGVRSAGFSSNLPYCTWGPESGGNWQAKNPTSTAGGYYQIIDSTWHAFGGPDYPGTHDAAQAPPALQMQIAAAIADDSLQHWVNC